MSMSSPMKMRVTARGLKGNDGKLSGFSREDNNKGLVVSIIDGATADNVNTFGEPLVEKTATAGQKIYGVLETITDGSEKLTIITAGIVRVKKESTTAAADLGAGIIATTTAGEVATLPPDNPAGKGKGTVVSRSGNYLWVDLCANYYADS